jgi:hypothetical protein
VHQPEEYSLPVIGLPYSLPDMVCGQFDYPPYPDCPIPMSFYPVVNISLMWFGAPLAAYICRRDVLIGLSSWGLMMANGVVHSAGGIAEGAYNTGLLTAAFLFIPLSLWVIYACAIRGPYRGKVVGAAFAAGAVTHAVLFLGYGLFKAGVIGNAGRLVYAAAVGFTPIILAALASGSLRLSCYGQFRRRASRVSERRRWCPCSRRVPQLGNALGGLGANMHALQPESRVSLFGATYRYTSSTHRSSARLPGHPLAPITIGSC